MSNFLVQWLNKRREKNRERICIKITSAAKELSEDNPKLIILGYMSQASNYETLVYTLEHLYEEAKRLLDNYIAEDPKVRTELRKTRKQAILLYYLVTFFGGRLGIFWI